MKPQDLDRIRFITRHFNELKGLSLVATGMLFLGCGVLRFKQGPFSLRPGVAFAIQILLIVGSVFLSFYSRSYYRKTFGEVEPVAGPAYRPPDALTIYRPAGAAPPASVPIKGPDQRFPGLMLLVMSLAVALYVALRMAGSSVEVHVYDALGREDPPLFVITQQVLDLVFGSMFLSTWLWRGRRLSQSYYLVLGVVMFVAAMFGAVNVLLLEPWPPRLVEVMRLLLSASMDMNIGQLLCGACLILAGLLDHWQLVRTLRPVGDPHAA